VILSRDTVFLNASGLSDSSYKRAGILKKYNIKIKEKI